MAKDTELDTKNIRARLAELGNADSPLTISEELNEVILRWSRRYPQIFRDLDNGESNITDYVGSVISFLHHLLNEPTTLQIAVFDKLSEYVSAIRSLKAKTLDRHEAFSMFVDELDKNIREFHKAHPTMFDAPLMPNEAPVAYIPRKSGVASRFLQKHWKVYIDAGVLFRPDLKRLDPKLEMALRNEFRGRPDELRAILPNRTDAADARLAAEFGGPVRPEDRKAAIIARSISRRVKTPTPKP